MQKFPFAILDIFIYLSQKEALLKQVAYAFLFVCLFLKYCNKKTHSGSTLLLHMLQGLCLFLVAVFFCSVLFLTFTTLVLTQMKLYPKRGLGKFSAFHSTEEIPLPP